MAKISCIVVDDEPLAARLIESYVVKTPFLDLRGVFNSGSAAFTFLQDNPIDLLFCDIQMPGLNGMELSRMLPAGTRIIFTTAFSEYAVEGFKVRALDYLLKPVSYEDFLASALKAKEYFDLMAASSSGKPSVPASVEPPGKQDAAASEAASLSASQPAAPAVSSMAASPAAAPAAIRSIFVKTEYRLQQIDLDRITFIEGLKDYVKIHLDDGTPPVLSLMRLKTLEDSLPSDRFVRVHKSFIVQTSRIEAIERARIIIGKDYIPIGETYQDALFRALSGSALLPADKPVRH
jgi:two-component system, LytTR family, response regulator